MSKFVVGQMATFKGYSETPEDGQDFLVEGQELRVPDVKLPKGAELSGTDWEARS